MSIQKRPLTGMVVAGVAAPRALTGADSVIHQCDTSAAQQGGAFVDLVTLVASNPTGGGVDLVLTPLGGAPITITIASKTSVVVFDQVPLQAVAGASGANTQVLGHGNGLVFWGWFARPL